MKARCLTGLSKAWRLFRFVGACGFFLGLPAAWLFLIHPWPNPSPERMADGACVSTLQKEIESPWRTRRLRVFMRHCTDGQPDRTSLVFLDQRSDRETRKVFQIVGKPEQLALQWLAEDRLRVGGFAMDQLEQFAQQPTGSVFLELAPVRTDN